MSWFDTTGITSFAKTALTTAQKTIDKALDIQEEKQNKKEKLSKIPETEIFFETFGLSDAPSTSQPEDKLPAVQNAPSASSNAPSPILSASVASQGSGFWVDAWGSFFEMKGPNPHAPSSSSNQKTNVENFIPESSPKTKNTVLSQPHRASPFPSDSIPTTDQSLYTEENQNASLEENISTEDVVEDKEQVLERKNEEATVSLNSEESKSSTTVEQLTESKILSLNKEESMNVASLSDNDSAIDIKVSENKSIENDCDKTVSAESSSEVIDENSVNIPKSTSVSCDSESKVMDSSSYLSLHVPDNSTSYVHKVESEYDVIEMGDSIMKSASDSFTRSASIEVVSSISQCSPNDISSSTVDIPDLPEGFAENIATWDWSAIENIPSDLSAVQSVSNHDGNGNQSLQMIVSDCSFHTITASSFADSQAWAKSEKSSHFTEESPNSSNGEQNSHHSDGSSNSSKDDDDTDTAEVKEYDTKSSSSCGSHVTSSSSFVKCSADENDSSSHRGPSPTSTTTSERSDVTKQESEQNTSGDENETATSSDIEILSPPNGENGDRNTSPLKHIWLPRPLRLRRSESPTSDCGKDSLMPVNELEETSYSIENKASGAIYSKESETSRKAFEDESLHNLLQRQEELQNILEAREKKILELSKENIELQENEQRLKNLVQKMRVEQAKDSKDITSLTKEFTQRLALVEGQLKEAIKDRDAFQRELEQAKKEISKRISALDIEETLKEKDVQIKELIEEGQKLSKKELHHTTIIKKLRAKEEEMNKTIKSQIEKLEENSKEVDRLRKSIAAKDDQEAKHTESIRQLTSTVKKLEKEVATLKSNLEDSSEKEQSLKKSLDSMYKDFTELRGSYSLKEKELEDLKAGLEIEANENLRQKLENAQNDASKEKETLLLEIQELRCTLSHTEQEANMREKMFKAEIASIQKRLQEAEERNEDLTKNVSSATRPLVRQIENLQATYNAQTISWEKIEKNLTDRLNDAQNQLALMSEKERSISEKYNEYISKINVCEIQNTSLRKEKMQLSAEVEALKAKIIMLEESKNRETYTSEKLKENFNIEIQKLKKEKAELEKTMSTCLEQLDLEKRRVSKLEEEIKFKDARALIMSNVSRSSSPTNSSIGSIHNWSQDDLHEHGTSTPVNSHRMSVYESLRLSSGSSTLEHLQSQLKQREGEIFQLQTEIFKLEQIKESMTRELVQLSEQNEGFRIKLDKLEHVDKDLKELDQKYNTLLQMYGEKIEETEELQLDLADVKSMYKAQIEELLQNK